MSPIKFSSGLVRKIPSIFLDQITFAVIGNRRAFIAYTRRTFCGGRSDCFGVIYTWYIAPGSPAYARILTIYLNARTAWVTHSYMHTPGSRALCLANQWHQVHILRHTTGGIRNIPRVPCTWVCLYTGERNVGDQRGGARGRADDHCPRPGGTEHAEALRSVSGPAQGKRRDDTQKTLLDACCARGTPCFLLKRPYSRGSLPRPNHSFFY